MRFDSALHRLFVVAVAVELALALGNLAYLPSDMRENREAREPREARVMADPNVGDVPAPWRPATLSTGLAIKRQFKRQLDLDGEHNLPTWFSSVQLALLAGACLLLRSRGGSAAWILVGLGFISLSADEVCQFHESAGVIAYRQGMRVPGLDGVYLWLAFLAVPLLAFAAAAVRLCRRDLAAAPTLRRRALLGLMCMAVSLPLEMLEGAFERGAPHPPRLLVIASETAEMFGATLLLFALVAFCQMRVPRPGETV